MHIERNTRPLLSPFMPDLANVKFLVPVPPCKKSPCFAIILAV